MASNTYPPVQPIRYMLPSYPRKAIRPAMLIKDAADIQSAAVAMPLATGGTCLPAI